MSLSPVLPPIPPAVLAKRRWQNRIVIALVVMILTPALVIPAANQWAQSMVTNWSAQQPIPFNTATSVHIGAPGTYVVWAFGNWTADEWPTCTVTYGETDISRPTASDSLGSYHSVVEFVARTPGEFVVECVSGAKEGYAMVSTTSPIVRAGIILLLGYFVGGAGAITGLVLLIVALASGSGQKRHAQPVPRQPWPPRQPGPPYGTVAPYPPHGTWPSQPINGPIPPGPPGPPGPPIPPTPPGPPTNPAAPPWPPRS